MSPFRCVAQIDPPFRPASGEEWAVISIDPSKRSGAGCAGTVRSFHRTEGEAKIAARVPA